MKTDHCDKPFLYLAIILLIVVHWGAHSSKVLASDIDYVFYDAYLNQDFTKKKLHSSLDWELTVETRDGKRSYIYQSKINGLNDGQHYILGMVVAQSGRLLEYAKYQEQYLISKHSNATQHKHEFPDIGKRAMQDSFFFGPRGSSYGLIFTTSDEKFDVKLRVSMLLPDTIHTPDIDIQEVAKTISADYDQYQIQKGKHK